jgi:hypothetical protein
MAKSEHLPYHTAQSLQPPLVVQGKDPHDQEDLVPDVPTDAIGRYVALLLRWEDLTR